MIMAAAAAAEVVYCLFVVFCGCCRCSYIIFSSHTWSDWILISIWAAIESWSIYLHCLKTHILSWLYMLALWITYNCRCLMLLWICEFIYQFFYHWFVNSHSILFYIIIIAIEYNKYTRPFRSWKLLIKQTCTIDSIGEYEWRCLSSYWQLILPGWQYVCIIIIIYVLKW